MRFVVSPREPGKCAAVPFVRRPFRFCRVYFPAIPVPNPAVQPDRPDCAGLSI